MPSCEIRPSSRLRRRMPTGPRGPAYKDINRLGFKLLAPGGALFTYSCSGGIGPGCSTRSWRAPAWMQVDNFIYARLSAAPDHPQTISFPLRANTSKDW